MRALRQTMSWLERELAARKVLKGRPDRSKGQFHSSHPIPQKKALDLVSVSLRSKIKPGWLGDWDDQKVGSQKTGFSSSHQSNPKMSSVPFCAGVSINDWIKERLTGIAGPRRTASLGN